MQLLIYIIGTVMNFILHCPHKNNLLHTSLEDSAGQCTLPLLDILMYSADDLKFCGGVPF